MFRRLIVPALALLSLALAAPAPAASAVLSGSQAQSTPSPAATQTIGDTSAVGSDERIARRIRGIFDAVPALENVTVSVNEGVVELGGTVPTPEDIGRAEEIASRVVGVVTVENGVQREVSLGESFEALGGVSGKISDFVRLLPLIGAALVLAFAIGAIGYLLSSFGWLWRRLAPNAFLAELIVSSIRFVFVIGGIVAGLQVIGAGALLGAVLGGAGIIGIALGFAMRDTIENYVASIMLSIRQPFRANDLVVIDQFEGRVIRLTSRATILMTLDGNHLRIPNATVFKAVILNYTRNAQRRFDFDLGIDAADDPTTARRLGIDVLSGLDFVLDDPPPTARLEQVGDSNIVIKFLGWIDQSRTDWFKARSLAIPAVKRALEEAGFALPEPIYRLRFDTAAPLSPPQAEGKGEAAAPAGPRPLPSSVPASEQTEHLAPDDVVADMVDRERKQSPEAEKDLLDPRRPVE